MQEVKPGGTTGAVRGRIPRLSEGKIIEAGLAVVKRDGLGALTMRGLAEELGATQMATYHYFKDKELLVEKLLETILATVPTVTCSPSAWEAGFAQQFQAVIDIVLSYPGVGSALTSMRLTRSGAVLIDSSRQLLIDAGYDEQTAQLGYATLHTYVFGRLAIADRLLRRAREGRWRARRPVDLRAEDFTDFGVRAVIAGIRIEMDRRMGVDGAQPPAATIETDSR